MAVGLSLCGVAFAFDPKLEGGIFIFFPLAVALALAGQSIIVRYHPKDSSITWAFYTEIVASCFAFVAFMTLGDRKLPFDQPFLITGVVIVDGLSIFLITHAFHGERAGKVAPLAYLSIVSGSFFGLIFLYPLLVLCFFPLLSSKLYLLIHMLCQHHSLQFQLLLVNVEW